MHGVYRSLLVVSVWFCGVILTGCATPSAQFKVARTISLLEENRLGSWKVSEWGDHGNVDVMDGILSIGLGDYLNGVVWEGELPGRVNYEIELQARKSFGSDFLLGLTVPVNEDYCTWICGGWGGQIVGISNIDDLSADRNETTVEMKFEQDKWYSFRIRVLENRIQCWIDGEPVIDVDIKGKNVSLRPGKIEKWIPLGIANFDTIGEYRNIVWRDLEI